ncbi:MAG: branched-chain amino acid ABC transporter permease [Limnochordales bacterium]
MFFWQLVLSGLSIGSLYAVVGLGIVLLYRTSRVLNFAHGDLAMVTTMIAYSLLTSAGVVFAGSVALTLLAAFALGSLFYFIVIRPVKEATLLGQIITTAGFALVLGGAAVVIWGPGTKALPFPLSRFRFYDVFGLRIDQLTIGSFIVSVITMLLLYLLVQKTKFGLAMRAVSQNDAAARVLGIPVRRVYAVTWGVSAVLGAIGGLLLAPVTFVSPTMMFDPFLKGFAAAVLGGLDSLPGVIIGGVILGVVENVFGGYVSTAFKSTVAFVMIIAVLLVRPEGLLGRKFQRRV